MNLAKSRFIKPYSGNKSNLLFAKDKAGVYIIKKRDRIVYIGYSENDVYSRCHRHFNHWKDKRQARVSYEDNRDNYTVRIILTTPARAARLERALIISIKPKDNPDKLRGYLPTPAETKILNDYEEAPAKNFAEMEEAPF